MPPWAHRRGTADSPYPTSSEVEGFPSLELFLRGTYYGTVRQDPDFLVSPLMGEEGQLRTSHEVAAAIGISPDAWADNQPYELWFDSEFKELVLIDRNEDPDSPTWLANFKSQADAEEWLRDSGGLGKEGLSWRNLVTGAVNRQRARLNTAVRHVTGGPSMPERRYDGDRLTLVEHHARLGSDIAPSEPNKVVAHHDAANDVLFVSLATATPAPARNYWLTQHIAVSFPHEEDDAIEVMIGAPHLSLRSAGVSKIIEQVLTPVGWQAIQRALVEHGTIELDVPPSDTVAATPMWADLRADLRARELDPTQVLRIAPDFKSSRLDSAAARLDANGGRPTDAATAFLSPGDF